ncbi:MAG: PAS domain-containing protein, partial [Deltaproteobacteria bacterium]
MGLESTKHELQNNLRINRFQITLIAATTIATILISLYCLFSGLFIVFQNLFYVPIILSCMYYTMRGFIYSVCLAVLYLLLILVFTSQSSIIMQALVRVFIFIIVAGVVTFLSARNKQDITERKRAEELLRQQKEEQQVIFDAVPAMIFFKDTENRFIRVNRALAQASGMTVEQMEGKSCFELFPDLADKYWKDDSEVIAAGVPKRDIIESMATPNGVAWVKTDKIPYWDEKGNITGIIGFAIDITALMNTENALRKHFLFLETLIDTIPNPIFYKNIKGEYTGCNNAFAIYMGIRKEEILGKTVYDLSPKELADVYKKTDRELFDHPGVQVYETQIKYADEALHDVVFNKATFTDEDGNVNGLVGVILD